MIRPAWRGRLPSAYAALKAFNKLKVSKKYPPMTKPLAYLVAWQLMQSGHRDMALAVLLGFEALLRICRAPGA
jgi:hypothetical protein